MTPKLRVLYQRKKGRDLFDLDYALRQGKLNSPQVLASFIHYVHRQGLRITAGQFRINMQEKMTDPRFGADIIPLIRAGIDFAIDEAYIRVEEQLLCHLDAAWSQIPVLVTNS